MEEEDAEKKRSRGLDRLSDLQDCLLRKVLLNVRTKDVVKTSVLSTRWRNLWRCVPGLDLGCDDFPDYDAFVSFVDRFLRFNSLQLQEFKLKSESLEVIKYDWESDDPDVTHLPRWINTVIKLKVQHLHVLEREWHVAKDLEIPPTVYTCESLVSLELREVTMANPKSVYLASLKVIKLDSVSFASDWAFEMLISGCRVLESLTVKRCPYGKVKVFRVCSQSLLRFTLVGLCDDVMEQDLEVAIDAPKLEYLNLCKDDTDRFIIHNLGSLVKVDTDTMFNLSYTKCLNPNDLPKRNIIRSFLVGISSVKDMVITSETLEVIYDYSTRCEPLPLFCNLSSLRVDFYGYKWEMLPIFLKSCTNLKSLFLGFSKFPGKQRIRILPGRHCFLPTLESVEIVKPMRDVVAFMRMARYFLEKSAILKKFSFCLGGFVKEEDESVILKELLAIPRLSSSCQVLAL